jgi:hypothetical protein
MSAKSKMKKPMAPNDPNRVPKEHRELVNKIYEVLRQGNFDVFQAQVITQAVSVIGRMSDVPGGLKAVNEIVHLITGTKDGQVYLGAILELLGMKMTEAFNKTKLTDIGFKNI